MTYRLDRIEIVTLVLVTIAATASSVLGTVRPLGIVLGGGAALLDFVILRRLAAAALSKRSSMKRVVPWALAKSVVLLAIPAFALLLPLGVVDGLSFALGVSALPGAIVIDALLRVPADGVAAGGS